MHGVFRNALSADFQQHQLVDRRPLMLIPTLSQKAAAFSRGFSFLPQGGLYSGVLAEEKFFRDE
jgi:hypothetical protein